MQFEQLDKKIKEAADHHHPAYDEKAWSGMEKLLNKHLPQKEDDRKRFLFFLLLLLGISGTGLLITKPWKGKTTIAANEQRIQQKPPGTSAPGTEPPKEENKKESTVKEEKAKLNSTGTVENNIKSAPEILIDKPAIISVEKKFGKKNKSNHRQDPPLQLTKSVNIRTDKNSEYNNQGQENSKRNIEADTKSTPIVEISKPVNDDINTAKRQKESLVVENPAGNSAKPGIIEPSKTSDVKEESLPIKQNKTANDKKKNKKSNSFFVTLSTGPDVSYADKSKLGTVKLLAGAGLGYTFKDRFTIRTGFYSGRKIYTASPDAYQAPAIFYTYYPNLEKVEADCKIYEIPVSISYNFGLGSKQKWFASAGISSYLMKSETYNYFYKYSPSGPTVTRKWIINNENKHYFSILTLSAGYLHNINKRISILVEPYIKMPLKGVGYGKVKLNSGGLLFSLGIKPFGSKKSSTNK